jgi:hypothetical protein
MQGSPRPEGGVVSAFAAVEVTDEDDDPGYYLTPFEAGELYLPLLPALSAAARAVLDKWRTSGLGRKPLKPTMRQWPPRDWWRPDVKVAWPRQIWKERIGELPRRVAGANGLRPPPPVPKERGQSCKVPNCHKIPKPGRRECDRCRQRRYRNGETTEQIAAHIARYDAGRWDFTPSRWRLRDPLAWRILGGPADPSSYLWTTFEGEDGRLVYEGVVDPLVLLCWYEQTRPRRTARRTAAERMMGGREGFDESAYVPLPPPPAGDPEDVSVRMRAARQRAGWPKKIVRYPPVSIHVPADEGGPTLWGVKGPKDYAQIVAMDLLGTGDMGVIREEEIPAGPSRKVAHITSLSITESDAQP